MLPIYISLKAKPLAQTIRKEKKIKGIELPRLPNCRKQEAKISMFADDTQLFYSSKQSIAFSLKILYLYSKASRAKVNLGKTKGVLIGDWKTQPISYTKIKWVEKCERPRKTFWI